MAGTVTDQLKRICRKMGGLDVSGTVTDLLAKIEFLSGTLPDGALINGTANFYRNTAPLTRVGGSALVIGDVWKKVGQDLAEWDGTQWVGVLQQFFILTATLTSTAASGSSFYPIGSKILLKKFEVCGRVEAIPTNPATDYWIFSLDSLGGGGPTALASPVSVNNQNINYTAFSNLFVFAATNQVVNFSGAVNNTGNPRGFFATWTKFGLAPNCTQTSFSIQYRIIYE